MQSIGKALTDGLLAFGSWHQEIDALHNAATIAAIILGGLWAYFKFIQGRVFRSQLEPKIEGEMLAVTGAHVARLKVSLRNTGLGRVKLDSKDSTIELLGFRPYPARSRAHTAIVKTIGVIDALAAPGTQWIEPNETIFEEHLVALPEPPPAALKACMRILQSGPQGFRNTWTAMAIIVAAPNGPKRPARRPMAGRVIISR